MYYKIPINTAPGASYGFRISLKGNTINLDVRIILHYLDMYDFWTMDVYNDLTKEPLVLNVPLVMGLNLLGQYEYLDVGEAYILNDKNSDLMHPDNVTLGNDFILVWGDAS